jgi:hypothetical protein
MKIRPRGFHFRNLDFVAKEHHQERSTSALPPPLVETAGKHLSSVLRSSPHSNSPQSSTCDLKLNMSHQDPLVIHRNHLDIPRLCQHHNNRSKRCNDILNGACKSGRFMAGHGRRQWQPTQAKELPTIYCTTGVLCWGWCRCAPQRDPHAEDQTHVHEQLQEHPPPKYRKPNDTYASICDHAIKTPTTLPIYIPYNRRHAAASKLHGMAFLPRLEIWSYTGLMNSQQIICTKMTNLHGQK